MAERHLVRVLDPDDGNRELGMAEVEIVRTREGNLTGWRGYFVETAIDLYSLMGKTLAMEFPTGDRLEFFIGAAQPLQGAYGFTGAKGSPPAP